MWRSPRRAGRGVLRYCVVGFGMASARGILAREKGRFGRKWGSKARNRGSLGHDLCPKIRLQTFCAGPGVARSYGRRREASWTPSLRVGTGPLDCAIAKWLSTKDFGRRGGLAWWGRTLSCVTRLWAGDTCPTGEAIRARARACGARGIGCSASLHRGRQAASSLPPIWPEDPSPPAPFPASGARGGRFVTSSLQHVERVYVDDPLDVFRGL